MTSTHKYLVTSHAIVPADSVDYVVREDIVDTLGRYRARIHGVLKDTSRILLSDVTTSDGEATIKHIHDQLTQHAMIKKEKCQFETVDDHWGNNNRDERQN